MTDVVFTAARASTVGLPLLVIEDEATIQAFLQIALVRSGYEVVIASSASEGLRLLNEREFLGVISDMRTPGGVTGADVHAWIAANRPHLVSKILFITGDIVNQETMRLLKSTGAPCIEKPFRVMELLRALNQVLES